MSCRYDGNMMAMQWNDMEYVTNIDNWMCSNMQYIDVGQLPTNMKGWCFTWSYYVLPVFSCKGQKRSVMNILWHLKLWWTNKISTPWSFVPLFAVERSKGPQKFHRLLDVCRHPPSSPRVSAGTSSRWPCDATAAGSRNDAHKEWRHSPGDAGRVSTVAG